MQSGQRDAGQPTVFADQQSNAALWLSRSGADRAAGGPSTIRGPMVPRGLEVELACQVDVAGADEEAAESPPSDPHHRLVDPIGEAAAGTKVGHLEAGQFLGAGLPAQPIELSCRRSRACSTVAAG